MAQLYTPNEMMTIAAARALRNDDVCFVGIGAPSAACNLARLTHAPDITLIYESGTIATKPDVLPLSIGDGELCETALTTVSVPEMFRYWLQGGRITVGFLGGAQIDRFANLNTTVVGAYDKPKVRLPGGGGAPEIAIVLRRDLHHHGAGASAASSTKLDFVTSLGHGEGGDHRARLGVKTKGPTRLDHRPLRLRAGPETQGDDGRPRSIRASRASRSTATPAGRCASPTRSPRRRAPTAARAAKSLRDLHARTDARPRRRRREEYRHMPEAFICDAVRTPIGRYGGALAKVRTDDLAAVPIKALMARNPKVDWAQLDEVIFGCANQAGEDNRNVARMALLLAGLPDSVPGITVNRLCASGLNAVGAAARAIKRRRDRFRHRRRRRVDDARAVRHGQGAARRSARSAEIYDTTIGWRFVNPLMKAAVRRRLDAGDRRERRRGVPGRARRPGRVRAALAAARRQGAWRPATSPTRSCRSRCRAARPARSMVDKDEHPRPDTTLEGARQAEDAVPRSPAPSPPATPPASTTAPPR